MSSPWGPCGPAGSLLLLRLCHLAVPRPGSQDGILHHSLCMSIQNFYVLEQVGEKSFSHPRGVGIDWAFW